MLDFMGYGFYQIMKTKAINIIAKSRADLISSWWSSLKSVAMRTSNKGKRLFKTGK